jgi:hypothetical protein
MSSLSPTPRRNTLAAVLMTVAGMITLAALGVTVCAFPILLNWIDLYLSGNPASGQTYSYAQATTWSAGAGSGLLAYHIGYLIIYPLLAAALVQQGLASLRAPLPARRSLLIAGLLLLCSVQGVAGGSDLAASLAGVVDVSVASGQGWYVPTTVALSVAQLLLCLGILIVLARETRRRIT